MKLFFNIILFVFIFAISFSKEIAIEQASLVAKNLFSDRNNSQIDFSYSSIETINKNNINLYYIFNLNPRGFIIVSADDRSLPILGYSFESDFVYDREFPSNLNYIFEMYESEISDNINSNKLQLENIKVEWNKYLSEDFQNNKSRAYVAPLMDSKWNQDNPWNGQCPTDQNGPGGNVYAGCVAVSMAQICYYWSFPEVGVGSHGYYSNYGYLSVNFGNQTYNYDDMYDNFASDEAQKLLYHLGVAIDMGYSPDGSGAWVGQGNPSAMTALRDHFLFDNSIDYISKNSLSNSDYLALIVDELNNNRPLISRGCSNDGCHAWNLDGYDGEYIHSNFGWGGSMDGYFALSSMGGFSGSQGIVFNLIPSTLDVPNVVLSDYNQIEVVGDFDGVYNPGETIELSIIVENLIPWNNASNIDVLLYSNNNQILVENNSFDIDFLFPGSSSSNNSSPFLVSTTPEIPLGNYNLNLMIDANGANNTTYNDSFEIPLNITLEQYGFPFESIDEVTVESSPLILTDSSKGQIGIFFGDHLGSFYGIDFNGNILFRKQFEDIGNNSIWSSPAAADIDNDGEIEIVITSKNKHCYILDTYGNIKVDYFADQYLLSTPVITNLDDDEYSEIVFSGYSSSGKIFAINHDGTNVEGFPFNLNKKVLRGAAVTDFNMNNINDIVVASDSDNSVYILWDGTHLEKILETDGKLRSAPSIVFLEGTYSILIGSEDEHFYHVDTEGNILFDISVNGKVKSSPAVGMFGDEVGIFFGTNDGYIYGLDLDGEHLDNWPVFIGDSFSYISPVFSDLDNDGISEIVIGSLSQALHIYNFNGSMFNNFPFYPETGISSSANIVDIDDDNDLEIVFGLNRGIDIIDIKNESNASITQWNMHRANNERTGYINLSSDGIMLGDLNSDQNLDILDIIVLVNLIISNDYTDSELYVGDINEDSTLNVLDIISLVNIILN